MDPRRVLVFRAVARAGSLSAAARDLGWTQPAVSQHLQRLEREVGLPLLVRSTRGVTLTEAGQVLLGRADAVAGQLHMASEEMASLAQLRGGRVRLVAFPSAAATLVPAALKLLAARPPEPSRSASSRPSRRRPGRRSARVRRTSASSSGTTGRRPTTAT